jgi:hypothetical protein
MMYVAIAGYSATIKEVQVDRVTDSSVFTQGNRRVRLTSYESYFDTWEEAKAHLLEYAEQKLHDARQRLQHAQAYHGNVKGMKKP